MEHIEFQNHKLKKQAERTIMGLVFLTFILTFIYGSLSSAKEFNYLAQYKGEKFVSKIQSEDKLKAFEIAALTCFQHFKNGRHLSESEGLDIIDVCANIKQQ
jgi:hypothetical protein